MDTATLPRFTNNIPLISGDFSNSKNIYIEEFLTFKNRRNEMELYLTEEYFSKNEFDLLQTLKELYVIGEFKLTSFEEEKGEFLSLNNKTFILSNFIFEEYGKAFYEQPISGKFKIQHSKSDNTFHIIEFEKFEWDATLEEWNNFRTQFTLKEWTSELLKMIGFDSTNLFFREKIIVLSRILPLLENNFAFLELGPKAVGKSTSYDLLKEHNFVTSGSSATLANTIYNNSLKERGSIFKTANLVLEEITTNQINPDLMNEIQTYLSSEKVTRGGASEKIQTSITFLGNLKIDFNLLFREHASPYLDNYFGLGKDPVAMLDRINFLNPSWGMRTIKKDMLLSKKQLHDSKRIPIGFFSKIITLLRKKNIQVDFINHYHLSGNKRTCNSISKNFNALIKLFAPNLINNPGIYLQKRLLDSLFFIACENRYIIDKILEKHDKQYNAINFINYNSLINTLYYFEEIEFHADIIVPHVILYKLPNNSYKCFFSDFLGVQMVQSLVSSSPFSDGNSTVLNFTFDNSKNLLNLSSNNNFYQSNYHNHIFWRSPNIDLLFGYSIDSPNIFENHFALKLLNNFLCSNCTQSNIENYSYETLICINCNTRYDSYTLKEVTN